MQPSEPPTVQPDEPPTVQPDAPPRATRVGPPRRPWLFWPALVVALAAVVGGAALAVTSYAGTRGPDGAVRGYFDALQHGDAAGALGFGDVPAGPRTLLTAAVLREQQRVAPIVDLDVGPVRRTGDRASVQVSYALHYPAAVRPVTVRIGVHEVRSGWRLDAVAVRTRLALRVAQQRASVLGDVLPSGDVLAFPGAPPIRFDSDYLELTPDAGIEPGATGAHVSSVSVTDVGRTVMQAAVLAAVRSCLTAPRPEYTCPLPADGRYLPGSVRGTTDGPLSDVVVTLDTTQVGTLEFTASVPVQATAYQRLDFHDALSGGRGPLTLAVRAIAAAHSPLVVTWLAP